MSTGACDVKVLCGALPPPLWFCWRSKLW